MPFYIKMDPDDSESGGPSLYGESDEERSSSFSASIADILLAKEGEGYNPSQDDWQEMMQDMERIIKSVPKGQVRSYLEWLSTIRASSRFQFEMLQYFFEFAESFTSYMRNAVKAKGKTLGDKTFTKQDVAKAFEEYVMDRVGSVDFHSTPENIYMIKESMIGVVPGIRRALEEAEGVAPAVVSGRSYMSFSAKMTGYHDVISTIREIESQTQAFIVKKVPGLLGKSLSMSIMKNRLNETFSNFVSKNAFQEEKETLVRFRDVFAEIVPLYNRIEGKMSDLKLIESSSSSGSLGTIIRAAMDMRDTLKGMYSKTDIEMEAFFNIDSSIFLRYEEFIDRIKGIVNHYDYVKYSIDAYINIFNNISSGFKAGGLEQFLRGFSTRASGTPTELLRSMYNVVNQFLPFCDLILTNCKNITVLFYKASIDLEGLANLFPEQYRPVVVMLKKLEHSFERDVTTSVKAIQSIVSDLNTDLEKIMELYKDQSINKVANTANSLVGLRKFDTNVSVFNLKISSSENLTDYMFSLNDEIRNICSAFEISPQKTVGLEKDIMNKTISLNKLRSSAYELIQKDFYKMVDDIGGVRS